MLSASRHTVHIKTRHCLWVMSYLMSNNIKNDLLNNVSVRAGFMLDLTKISFIDKTNDCLIWFDCREYASYCFCLFVCIVFVCVHLITALGHHVGTYTFFFVHTRFFIICIVIRDIGSGLDIIFQMFIELIMSLT